MGGLNPQTPPLATPLVTGVRTPQYLTCRGPGAISALDPCNNCYIITMRGMRREERKGRSEDPLNIWNALTPVECCLFWSKIWIWLRFFLCRLRSVLILWPLMMSTFDGSELVWIFQQRGICQLAAHDCHRAVINRIQHKTTSHFSFLFLYILFLFVVTCARFSLSWLHSFSILVKLSHSHIQDVMPGCQPNIWLPLASFYWLFVVCYSVLNRTDY